MGFRYFQIHRGLLISQPCATVSDMSIEISFSTPFTALNCHRNKEKQTNGKIILKSFSSLDGNYSINEPWSSLIATLLTVRHWRYHTFCCWQKLSPENAFFLIFLSNILCMCVFFFFFIFSADESEFAIIFSLRWKILKAQFIQCTFLIETMVTNVGYTNNYILSLLMCAHCSQ